MKDLTEVLLKQGKRFYPVVSLVTICFAITVCELDPVNPVHLSYAEAVKKVTFVDNIATVGFSNLNHHDIYLVKINSSGSIVPAENTGGALQALSVISSQEDTGIPLSAANSREDSIHLFHSAIHEFNANLPSIDRTHSARMATTNFSSYSVGDKSSFWVERTYDSDNWENRQATLMASGDHGNIWVMDENTPSGSYRNKISTRQAEELARRFDLIYPVATNLLGYEYGGGPEGDGGMDGDKKIQILIYDIVNRHGEVSVGGYFWSKDFYTQDELDSLGLEHKTNLAEIFYINASTVINSPDYTYTALIHEFQHMISFNRKFVKYELNSSSWYDEMLSVMAEDIIAPLIGIHHSNPDHTVSRLIPRFLNSYYKYGITEWKSDNDSYSVLYAFGAYLLRNYGGPELLEMILDNDKTDIDSITIALKGFQEDMDFEQALNRYSETMIFSDSTMPEGIVTFNRTVTNTVNGQEYTAYGFNIWQICRFGTDETGPVVFNESPASMRPHSLVIQSIDGWKDRTGNFSISLEEPSDPNVVLYLMARQ